MGDTFEHLSETESGSLLQTALQVAPALFLLRAPPDPHSDLVGAGANDGRCGCGPDACGQFDVTILYRF